MKHFQTPRHGRKRAPRPTARDLAVGHDNAKAINRGVMTLHIRPIRSSDHRKRYTPAKPLNVRAFTGGPTWCKIIIVAVERIPLDQALTLANAKHAGYRTTAELAAAFECSYGKGRKDKPVWVVHFRLDLTETPRMLAATGGAPPNYRLGADGRWHYVERHDDREGDRGYTSTVSHALRDELPALSDDDWRTHVARNKDLTHDRWVALDHTRERDAMKRAHTERGRMMRGGRLAA
jgi:hypothetical protein